jgi:uncharacterized protein YunC (DUF1805 family)
MNKIALFTLIVSLTTPIPTLGDEPLNNDLQYSLAKPLLIIKESKGFLACAYINPETCNKTGEACAIVSGVNSHDDMKKAKITAVSDEAAKLGISVGDPGIKALEILK